MIWINQLRFVSTPPASLNLIVRFLRGVSCIAQLE